MKGSATPGKNKDKDKKKTAKRGKDSDLYESEIVERWNKGELASLGRAGLILSRVWRCLPRPGYQQGIRNPARPFKFGQRHRRLLA